MLIHFNNIFAEKEKNMKANNPFEKSIPKKDDYIMTKYLTPYFKDQAKRIQGITDDEYLNEHLN